MAGFRRRRDEQPPYGQQAPYPPYQGQPTYQGGPPYQSGQAYRSGPPAHQAGGPGYPAPPPAYQGGDPGYAPGPHHAPAPPEYGYGYRDDYDDQGYDGQGYAGPDGGYGEPAAPAPPPLPPLGWRALLTGIVFRPSDTFWRMRDYPMWVTALIVTFLYGLLAVFGLDDARESLLNTTASAMGPYLLVTGTAMVLGALLLSTVTHNLARQLGGNGLWAPTAGLAMLIMALTDVPRLAFALFLGGGAPLVQVLGWATWLGAGVLFTMMLSRSHEIAWPRALAAATIQLLAVLMLVKLGTI
ncbi:Yip1 family protein [Streptomyces hoynatensis]|uniref:YIP1 family protein n=1 Tax=Streptomyces hoynatensis TaxID=1141874 RepID=A0A3A9YJ69_9ACTN|nr:Yip1 family protein [Streptomyces hoynatensis]RKN36878.1 YIP1 family protein [Streptomyces hoynatensis]